MIKLDLTTFPQDIQAAAQRVEAVLMDRFHGRSTIPSAVIGTIQLDDDDKIYFVMGYPGRIQRDTITKAALALDKARDRGEGALLEAIEKSRSAAIVECCYYVSGMPEVKDKEEPRVVARDYLKALRDEPGALGNAFGTVANAVLEMLEPKGATLGKL